MTRMASSAGRSAPGRCMNAVVAAFIGVVGLVSAGTANAANWSGNTKISSIEISNVNAEGIWLTFTSAPYPSHTCSIKNGQWRLGGGQTNINHMVDLANLALMNNRNIAVYWVGCDGPGTTGYPVLLGITVK